MGIVKILWKLANCEDIKKVMMNPYFSMRKYPCFFPSSIFKYLQVIPSGVIHVEERISIVVR